MKSSNLANANINSYSDQYEIEEEFEDEEDEDEEEEDEEESDTENKNKIESKPSPTQVKTLTSASENIKSCISPSKNNNVSNPVNKTFQNLKPPQPLLQKNTAIETKQEQSPNLKAQPQGKPIQNQYKVKSPIHEESSSSDESKHKATAKFNAATNPKFNQTNSSDIPLYEDKFCPDIGFYETEKVYMLSSDSNTLNPFKLMHKENEKQAKLAQPHSQKFEKTLSTKKSDTRYIGSDDEGVDSNEDIENELVGESQQILDYQRSISSKYRFNTSHPNVDQNNQTKLTNQKLSIQPTVYELQGNQKKRNEDELKALPSDDDISLLKKENLKLRQQIIKIESEHLDKVESELSDLKQKLSQKTKEVKEANHKLNVTEEINAELESGISDLKSKIQNLKQELQSKDEKLNKATDDTEDKIKGLKEKNYSLTSNIQELEEELNRRTSKIGELQAKIDNVEQEKKEAISKVMAELMAIKDNQMNYEQLRMSNLELKNTNDLMSLKLATLSEENNTLRREVFFLEKELSNKSNILHRITLSKGSENDYSDISSKARLRTQESDYPESCIKQEKERDSYKWQLEEQIVQTETRKNKNFSQIARPESSNANSNTDNYLSNITKNQRSTVFGGSAVEKPASSNQSKQISKKDPNTSSQPKDSNLLAFNNKPEGSSISALENKISNLQTERLAVSTLRNYNVA